MHHSWFTVHQANAGEESSTKGSDGSQGHSLRTKTPSHNREPEDTGAAAIGALDDGPHPPTPLYLPLPRGGLKQATATSDHEKRTTNRLTISRAERKNKKIQGVGGWKNYSGPPVPPCGPPHTRFCSEGMRVTGQR